MLKRYEDALMQRIDAAATLGFSCIDWWELYLWYNMERIGKTVWRDLQSRFEEVSDDSKSELWVYESEKGLLLIHSDNLKKLSDRLSE